jgi:hypothetical protein
VLHTPPQDGFIDGVERRTAPIARSIEEYFSIFTRGMKRIHQHRQPYKKSYPYQAGSEALSAVGEASWQYVS